VAPALVSNVCFRPIADISGLFHNFRMKQVSVGTFVVLLAACVTPAVAQANKNFSGTSAPELMNGFELRDRYNLPKHLGETAIYIDSVSVHHVRSEASTIMWKGAAGKWQRSQVVEIGPGGLLTIPRKLESNETRTLTAAEAQSVERLIKDPGLYSGEVQRTGELTVDSWFHVMEIISPYGRTTLKWDGRLLGKSGEIADVMLGHD
jgi:hypothetical protein